MQKRTYKWKKNLTERELRGIESENKSQKSLIWCLFTVFVKKKIHDDVVIRIRNKYNQAFNLRLRYKQQTLQYLQILSLETFRDAA